MQKIYSLLRDNKRTGPYALEELVALTLKPYDLIWVEGKSGGWCYPNELDELKPFLSVKEEPASKSDNQVSVAKKENSTPNSVVASAARKVFVSLPGGANTPLANFSGESIDRTSSPVPAIDEAEESPEEKLERKARELRDRIQAFSEKKNLPKEDNELDVKYSRSLDDIKEEYSSWIHEQKKKKKNNYKPLLYAPVVLLIFLAVWGVKSMISTDTSDPEVIISEAKPIIQNSQESIDNTKAENEKKYTYNSGKIKEKKPIAVSANSTDKHNDFNSQIESTDKYIDSLVRAEKNYVDESENESHETMPAKSEHEAVAKTSGKSSVEESPKKSEQPNRTASSRNSIPLDQLIRVVESSSEKRGKAERTITLHNNSNQNLKFVAVDILYYKANKKLLQKKTLYFHDIMPGASAALTVPNQRSAMSLQYQLGLISSDKGLYYAKQ